MTDLKIKINLTKHHNNGFYICDTQFNQKKYGPQYGIFYWTWKQKFRKIY